MPVVGQFEFSVVAKSITYLANWLGSANNCRPGSRSSMRSATERPVPRTPDNMERNEVEGPDVLAIGREQPADHRAGLGIEFRVSDFGHLALPFPGNAVVSGGGRRVASTAVFGNQALPAWDQSVTITSIAMS